MLSSIGANRRDENEGTISNSTNSFDSSSGERLLRRRHPESKTMSTADQRPNVLQRNATKTFQRFKCWSYIVVVTCCVILYLRTQQHQPEISTRNANTDSHKLKQIHRNIDILNTTAKKLKTKIVAVNQTGTTTNTNTIDTKKFETKNLRSTRDNTTSAENTPIRIDKAAASMNTKENSSTEKDSSATIEEDFHPTSKSSPSLSLRYDWTNLEPLSPLARRMVQHQSNCSLPLGNFGHRNIYGLGSDLHLWGQGLCNAMESKHRIRTIQPWAFWDQEACSSNIHSNTEANETIALHFTGRHSSIVHFSSKSLLSSAMTCYFPRSENLCPDDNDIVLSHPTYDDTIWNITDHRGWLDYDCPSIMNPKDDESKRVLRRAAIEFLFTSVSSLVVQEAERQLPLVFGNVSQVPKNLITVHIRWGDKNIEMKLVSIEKYIDAINEILEKRKFNGTRKDDDDDDDDDEVNIFLATEDPRAVRLFRSHIPSNWTVYTDQYYVEMLPHRNSGYNGNPIMSKKLRGRTGFVALGSLLVALEANDFILTTGSNWSRVLNEIRLSILNPRCNNCTQMIDLHSTFEW